MYLIRVKGVVRICCLGKVTKFADWQGLWAKVVEWDGRMAVWIFL